MDIIVDFNEKTVAGLTDEELGLLTDLVTEEQIRRAFPGSNSVPGPQVLTKEELVARFGEDGRKRIDEAVYHGKEEKIKPVQPAIELRPIVSEDAEIDSLLKRFKEREITVHRHINGRDWPVASLRINQAINLNPVLTKVIGESSNYRYTLSQEAYVESVYINVAGLLVRMDLGDRANTIFKPRMDEPTLDLEVMVQVSLDNQTMDAFGDRLSFMGLVYKDDSVNVQFKLTGEYNPKEGRLIFSATDIDVIGTGSSLASTLAGILSNQVHVLSVDPVVSAR